jgi:endogenous inhibitor of DNA gyrase (YacG/DUF329 family)
MSCPICDKPAEKTYRPFCSRRCADLDLGRWLNGSYAVPVVEEDGGEDWDALGSETDVARH